MKLRCLSSLLGLMLLAAPALLAGCGAPADGGVTNSGPGPVSFDFTLTSLLSQPAAASPPSSGGYTPFDVSIPGVLLVTNTDTLEFTTYDWPAFLDTATMTMRSSRTLLLEPGPYDFYLLLVYGAQQYAGTAHAVVALDGPNSIPMTIRPIFGTPAVSVMQVAELPFFKFQYDPIELSGFLHPQLGIEIDGGTESIYALNPVTGISDVYFNLSAGTHQLRLRFYTGGLQIGKSREAQESVSVVAGADLRMDLIAIFGIVDSVLDVGTGVADIQYDLPSEILEELGGDQSLLTAIFSIAGPENPIQEVLLGPSPSAVNYTGSLSLSGMLSGNVAMMFGMHENTASPPKWFASCVVAQAFLGGPVNTKLCRFILKRSVVSGDLLATVGVNVLDASRLPVPGAIVSVDGEVMGVTGSGSFGSPGYLKLTLPAGPHRISAVANSTYGEIDVVLSPLEIANVDIILGTPP